MKSMTPRQHKVAAQVQHIIAAALLQGRVHSTLNLARVTVLDCWVSPDLKLARLYLQLPQGTPQAEFFKAINAEVAAPLRKYLATQLASKYIPQVTFFPAEEEQL